ncbi:hypothetical protein EV141_0151 [Microcella putealis]|uniref:Uncharacterized protein n=1 Tax=Microcella putealis TaxID=337005 RepID=A0A4Q7LXH1_9MICO|nr:hypothetical protein [Microcella putealis]RZS58938.1 hypothetical protein EV141_0151 [Microcella putealis]TQM23964.1 hypothetical protein BJ957_1430 [Microcella putealis]
MNPEGDDKQARASATNERFKGHPPPGEPPVFEKVSDRDLITLADVLCRSMEFHSMLVAWKIINEVTARDLWPAVRERRAQAIRRSNADLGLDESLQVAEHDLERFRNEHFPVEPERFDSDPVEAQGLWNRYIQF